MYNTTVIEHWPSFNSDKSTGCDCCPLGLTECKAWRRFSANAECPCEVYDTYSDFIAKESEPDES